MFGWFLSIFILSMLESAQRQHNHEDFPWISWNWNVWKSLNANFIALIPKKASVAEVKDYHLIILMSGGCTKFFPSIVNKLSKVLEYLISKPQNTFLKGQQILDLVPLPTNVWIVDSSRESRGFCASCTWKKPIIMSTGDSTLHAQEMWLWHKIVYLNPSLYRYGLCLYIGEWHAKKLFRRSQRLRQGDSLSSLIFFYLFFIFLWKLLVRWFQVSCSVGCGFIFGFLVGEAITGSLNMSSIICRWCHNFLWV